MSGVVLTKLPLTWQVIQRCPDSTAEVRTLLLALSVSWPCRSWAGYEWRHTAVSVHKSSFY